MDLSTSQGIAIAISVTHSYMMTKNPAPIPIANSVSNMIDPPDGTPAPGYFVGLDLGDFVAPAGGPPFRLLEPYLRLTTLLASVPSTIESRCLATAAMISLRSGRASSSHRLPAERGPSSARRNAGRSQR